MYLFIYFLPKKSDLFEIYSTLPSHVFHSFPPHMHQPCHGPLGLGVSGSALSQPETLLLLQSMKSHTNASWSFTVCPVEFAVAVHSPSSYRLLPACVSTPWRVTLLEVGSRSVWKHCTLFRRVTILPVLTIKYYSEELTGKRNQTRKPEGDSYKIPALSAATDRRL